MLIYGKTAKIKIQQQYAILRKWTRGLVVNFEEWSDDFKSFDY